MGVWGRVLEDRLGGVDRGGESGDRGGESGRREARWKVLKTY